MESLYPDLQGRHQHPRDSRGSSDCRRLPLGHYGIRKRDQSVDDVVAVDTVLHHVRIAPLTIESASRIVDILIDRGLIESATVASDGLHTVRWTPLSRPPNEGLKLLRFPAQAAA